MNLARNWLKHWDKLRDDETICLDLEQEAAQYIARALINLRDIHGGPKPSQESRFHDWVESLGPGYFS